MLELTILSPHRDDAAFSLSVALLQWCRQPVKLRVVNFFSKSEYGPRALPVQRSTISESRKREDHSALGLIDPGIRITTFGLLDAPLRFGVSASAVCRPETADLQGVDEIQYLASQIRKYFVHGLVLAPLALGGHVDHLAVNQAALASCRNHQLGFYEDLPYATWTPEASLRERVSFAEERARVTLKSYVIGSHDRAMPKKLRVISRYRTQISREEGVAIARFAFKYGGGERIWIPSHSTRWRPLVQ